MMSHLKPREKLLTLGPSQLSDTELLALFLRTGTPNENLGSLAYRLLTHFGSISAILHSNYQDLDDFKGIGISKWAQLKAATELVSRSYLEQLRATPSLHNQETIQRYLRTALGHLEHEVFICLFLDTHHQLIAHQQLFRGSIDETAIYIREIIKECLLVNGKHLIIAHNHPGGSLHPSLEDLILTEKLATALQWIEVVLVDHYIVTKSGVTSMSALKMMPNIDSNH